MNFDKSPKDSSKESSRMSIDSNSTPPPNFQLPPEYWWNSSIPKNNLREILDPANLRPPRKPIPDDGTFSPIPPDFRYTAKFPSHYPPSTLDWGEPSFDVDYSDGSIPEKIPMKDEIAPAQNNNNIPAQGNIPVQNNIPAQDDGFQYLDIDMWNNDEIINQLHLSNSLFNDEESNQDKIAIPQEAVPNPISSPVPAQTPVQAPVQAPVQVPAPFQDLFQDLFQTSFQAPVQVPAPIPTPSPAPATQNNNGQYIYENLEKALGDWVPTLKISKRAQRSYKTSITEFIRILDIYGTFNPNQKVINNYISKYFEKNNHNCISNFRSITKQFFKWVNDNYIYNKIVPHKNKEKIVPSQNAQLIQIRLLNLLKRWFNALKNDDNTKIAYQTYVINLIAYLTKIPSYSPTLEDIKTYFKNNPQFMSPNMFSGCKAAIYSFLQFIESRGIPQKHSVYKFLKSNDPI